MDWDQYKKLCDRPDVLSRWLLEQTIAVCDENLSAKLHSILTQDPLKKPPDHKGGRVLDMFHSALTQREVLQIETEVRKAVDDGKLTCGELVRDYTGIAKAWSEYHTWLHRK